MAWKAHRRIDVSGGFSADYDWASDNTLPTFADDEADLDGGEILPFVPSRGRVLVMAELRDGMTDAAAQVAAGTFTYTAGTVDFHRAQGENVVTDRTPVSFAQQETKIEDELGSGNQTFIRVTAAADLGAANAIWIYTDVEV